MILGKGGYQLILRTAIISALLLLYPSYGVSEELKPGETLNRDSWQGAKNLLPEGLLHRFQDGSYQAQIATLPSTVAWGSKFKSATEANAGKFAVNAEGALVTKDTNTVPSFLYGQPFAQIDANDPQAAAKVIYNFTYTLMQADDSDRSSSLRWITPTTVQNSVEFRTQLLFHGARFSGPIENPDATLRKGIIAGISPSEVDGVLILEWVYLDPQRWNCLWMYAPELRRVRQLPPFNGSDSLFGSDLAHDDPYLFSGKVQYFTWKLVGVRDAFVPYVPARPHVLQHDSSGYGLEERKDSVLIGAEKEGWQGTAWWPTTVQFVKRPVWAIEATAKDPKYAYGRQVLWIDRELYLAYYKEAYNRAGQLWRSLMNAVTVTRTPEGDFSVAHPDFTLSVDELLQRATIETAATRNGRPTRFSNGLADRHFTSTGLAQRGK